MKLINVDGLSRMRFPGVGEEDRKIDAIDITEVYRLGWNDAIETIEQEIGSCLSETDLRWIRKNYGDEVTASILDIIEGKIRTS